MITNNSLVCKFQKPLLRNNGCVNQILSILNKVSNCSNVNKNSSSFYHFKKRVH